MSPGELKAQVLRYYLDAQKSTYAEGWSALQDTIEFAATLGVEKGEVHSLVEETNAPTRWNRADIETPTIRRRPRGEKGTAGKATMRAPPAPLPLARLPHRPLVRPREPAHGTLATLQRTKVSAPDDLLAGLIPGETAGALIGAAKAGKSFLLTQLGLAVATGAPDFLSRALRGGPVLMLALEQAPAVLARRIESFANAPAQWPDNFHVRYRNDFTNKNFPDAVAILETLCAEIRPRLLILDTLVAIAGAPSGQSLYTADYRQMDALRALAERQHTTLLTAHHTAKRARGNDPAADSVSTSGFSAGAGFLLELVRRPGSSRAKLLALGNDIAHQTLALHWDSSRWWSLSNADSSEQGHPRKRERAKAWLLQKLAAGPAPSATLYADATREGIGSSKLLESCKAELGLVSRKAGKVWLWERIDETSSRISPT